MDPLQDAGPPNSHSQSHHDAEDHMATTPGAGRKRVGFTSDAPRPFSTQSPDDQDTGSGGHNTPLQRPDVTQDDLSAMRESLRLALAEEHTESQPPPTAEVVRPDFIELPRDVQRPRPAIRKGPRTPPEFYLNDNPFDDTAEILPSAEAELKQRSGLAAQQRAARLSKSVGTYSAPVSRRNSRELVSPPVELQDLTRTYDFVDEAIDEEDDPQFMKRASMLLRQHTIRAAESGLISPEDLYHTDAPLQSGQVTPDNIEVEDERVSRPTKYRTGVLGTLLRANTAAAQAPGAAGRSYKNSHARNLSASTFSGASTAANSPNPSPPQSGYSTPRAARPWFRHQNNQSGTSISQLVGYSARSFATPAQQDLGQEFDEQVKKTRPGMGKRTKSDESVLGFKKAKRRDTEIKIKIHLAGTLARQNYLRKLCKALMMYGAPTHRLEEYLNMSARVLEIEAQFLYMPGCMIVAFDDSSVHTSEVKLVRTTQGVDLGKLRDVHEIYKDVVHDRIGVEEATPRLDEIMGRKAKFRRWFRVFMYGCASATVGPFAFQARFIDLPFCFLLGCLIGWLQLIVAPGNDLISNVFEIGASVITSFAARALGSIKGSNGKEIFCFSAMAQSSIALILPGFMVLCASLELQSKHIVAGSVRMVYAIIYSLFLGFGITIGTVLYGMMDKNATSRTTCHDPMSTNFYYLFVPAFALCLMIVNQAKYKQMPSMTVIAFIGWVVNFHSSTYFKSNAQVSNTLGALAIGIAANIHARFGRHVENWCISTWEDKLRPRLVKIRKVWRRRSHGPLRTHKVERSEYNPTHSGSQPTSRASSVSDFVPHTRKIGYGLAAAAMLPAIFVQVPSGLSVQGSLVSGLVSADQIVRNSTANATTISAADVGASSTINSIALNVGFSVIQIAIGITVGLFLAALIVYPLGKRRSGLFSF
ncbi:hypothetical protein HBI56_055470 [Parastagonospora nodorum]|nr:hypothetical protein HBI10_068450 [Parastagonospora nodorum]KAH4028056.1 hypothetical protein HBI13_049570 [Parastagonospora nodorum]KAH4927899.1 hypothetical protein HBH74_108370 [Parastagonospora nodorum]KAH4965726.1 hypothetical protein HBH73_063260 [Parastagonospora nodorum]KAH5104892.1 hypothetical protein HBH72_065180 [Parastagonospora nodorum]